MKKYEKYKDSGVEWIGEIPEHWVVKKLKNICTLVNEKTSIKPNYILTLENIVSWRGEIIGNPYETKIEGDVNLFKTNDILFNKLRPYLAKVVKATASGGCVSELLVLRANGDIEPDFLFYRLISEAIISIVDNSTYGTKMPRASWEKFISLIEIPIPTLPEQIAIANYLNHKTQQLDTLIQKKEQLITLLEEERTALINQAVTKGLDPSVPMKESGVEWLGKIPAHWEVKKLKYLIRDLLSGVSVNSHDRSTTNIEEIGVLKTSCVYDYSFRPEENKSVLEEENERVKCPVFKDSIIISRMNTPELVGASGYVAKDFPNLYLPDRLWITTFYEDVEINVKWLSFVFISDSFKKILSSRATGTSASMKNISKDDLLTLPIPFPNKAEQSMIVDFIEVSNHKINTIITKTQQEIELLKEYKTALISEVVTGKVDVREEMLETVEG